MKIWITISFILYADEKYLDLCLVYYTWLITGWNTIGYKFVIEHAVLGLVLEVIWWLLYMKFSLKIQQNLIEKTQNCLLHEQDCRTDWSSQARKLVSLFPPFFFVVCVTLPCPGMQGIKSLVLSFCLLFLASNAQPISPDGTCVIEFNRIFCPIFVMN